MKEISLTANQCLLFVFFNSDSNSSSSDGSRARSVQSSATHAPAQSSLGLDSEEPRRSFGIKVQNLPVRSTGRFLCLSRLSFVCCRLEIVYKCFLQGSKT